MRFRVGVHLGDVIEKGDGTIYGDGVNNGLRPSMRRAAGLEDSGAAEALR